MKDLQHRLSAKATQRELRLCGFALLNHYLTMHQVIVEHVQLPPVETLILIATTTGNVQRALRPGSLPQALRGSKPLPPELVVPMSRVPSPGSPGCQRRPYDGMWRAW